MSKTKYEEIKIEVIPLEAEDILTTSGYGDDSEGNYEFGW